jgi:hypothetical protein
MMWPMKDRDAASRHERVWRHSDRVDRAAAEYPDKFPHRDQVLDAFNFWPVSSDLWNIIEPGTLCVAEEGLFFVAVSRSTYGIAGLRFPYSRIVAITEKPMGLTGRAAALTVTPSPAEYPFFGYEDEVEDEDEDGADEYIDYSSLSAAEQEAEFQQWKVDEERKALREVQRRAAGNEWLKAAGLPTYDDMEVAARRFEADGPVTVRVEREAVKFVLSVTQARMRASWHSS